MGQVGEPADRIDGWKSIAGYLGRDRSTAIRWARERGLPIHALPGGRSRSVYALAHELDAWTSGQNMAAKPEDAAAPDPAPAPAPLPAPPLPDRPASAPDPVAHPIAPVMAPSVISAPPKRRRRWIVAAGALMLLGGTTIAISHWPRGSAPIDAGAQARYVAARDDVAMRAAPRLRAAIATLSLLAREHPDHGGIQAALAEAWLLEREFGSAPDTLAFARASAAAEAARSINPDSAVADRVQGVIAYWRDRDPPRAGRLFRRAIEHAPADPLAHLWYANVLADNGEDAAAFREFDAARMLAPGAPWLLADYGWGLWSAGRTAESEALLQSLARQYPTLASVQDCLSVMALARGDLPGYARHLAARARSRDESELATYSAALARTIANDRRAGLGYGATHAVMLSRAISVTQNAERPDHSWPAFVAAMTGDHTALLSILADAQGRSERWGAAGFVRRIRARFADDTQVAAAIHALAQERIEPD